VPQWGQKIMPLNNQDVSIFRNEREALRFWASPGVVFVIPALGALFTGLLVGGLFNEWDDTLDDLKWEIKQVTEHETDGG